MQRQGLPPAQTRAPTDLLAGELKRLCTRNSLCIEVSVFQLRAGSADATIGTSSGLAFLLVEWAQTQSTRRSGGCVCPHSALRDRRLRRPANRKLRTGLLHEVRYAAGLAAAACWLAAAAWLGAGPFLAAGALRVAVLARA